jgi:hypothetical protein
LIIGAWASAIWVPVRKLITGWFIRELLNFNILI